MFALAYDTPAKSKVRENTERSKLAPCFLACPLLRLWRKRILYCAGALEITPPHGEPRRFLPNLIHMDGLKQLLVSFSSPGDHTSTHTIYCKRHSVSRVSEITPNNRTLFTLGWPPYCDEECIRDFFSRVGHVTDVYLQTNPGTVEDKDNNSMKSHQYLGFKISYIVFSTEEDLLAALKLCSVGTAIPCNTSTFVGVVKWCRHYTQQRPSVSLLEERAEMGVSLYDQKQEAAAAARKRVGQPDEDGWITITRKTHKYMVRVSSTYH